VVGAGTSSPMGFFIMFKKLFNRLVDCGFSPDKYHHTHSKYLYDCDGICINKGDWLQNVWTGRRNEKAKPKSIDNLKYLLDKQARLEILGGWVTNDDREVLHYYLMEYFYSSIDFSINETSINRLIVDTVNDVCRDNRCMVLNDLFQPMTEKGGKVEVEPNITDQKERARLYKQGEKKFNEYWIRKMILGKPGKTAYYYHKYSKEFTQSINGGVGWAKNTIQKVIDELGQ
jgi:hypothetical protein